MTLAAPPPYVAEPAEGAGVRDTVLSIWRNNLGDATRMAAKYDWFYRDAPLGAPLTMILRHSASGEAVGAASAGPRRMRIDGREVSAGVLVDLAVLPAHRTLGPALILQQSLIDAAAGRFDFIYGFPNEKAAPVFKRVGYRAIGDLVRYARVLRHHGYLRRIMPAPAAMLAAPLLDLGVRLRDAWRRRADPRLVANWAPPTTLQDDQRNAGPGVLHGVHDPAFLHWRFAGGPIPTARWLQLRDARGGDLRAWFVCHVEDGVLHVADCAASDGSAGLARAHVDALLAAARAAGYPTVSIQLAGPADAIAPWLAAGFSARARRPIFGRWFGSGSMPQACYLTAADEDE